MSEQHPDPIITRSELPGLLKLHTDTIRRAIKEKKIPTPDYALSRKAMGWKRSTLRAAGINV